MIPVSCSAVNYQDIIINGIEVRNLGCERAYVPSHPKFRHFPAENGRASKMKGF